MDPVDTSATDPTFLFVQLADTGTWEPKPGEDGIHLLTLSGVGEQTLYFSDRPDRIVGTVPNDRFLESLGFTPVNPPNAAIVVVDVDGARDVLVVELMNPVYIQDFSELGDASLIYEARVLENYRGTGLEYWDQQQVDDKLAEGFSSVSLFIDDCPDFQGACVKAGYSWETRTYIGPIAIGSCYHWDKAECLDCQGTNMDEVGGRCNQIYQECQGLCGAFYRFRP